MHLEISPVRWNYVLKRLSSCGAAFVLSLERHLLRNWVFVHALETGGALPIGHVDDTLWEDDDGDDGQEILIEDADIQEVRTPQQWASVAQRRYDALVRQQVGPLAVRRSCRRFSEG